MDKGNFYLILFFFLLAASIGAVAGGICLRKKIRKEFVYLMTAGGTCLVFITLLLGAFWGILFGDWKGVPEESMHVSQQETQTTDVISGSAVDALVSDNMESEEYFPVTCQKKERELIEKRKAASCTWEEPFVVQNPYGNSPLTAYIFFETEKACQVRIKVKGKTKNADVEGIVKKEKNHRIPVVGLYADYENKVEVTCVDDEGKKIRKQTILIPTKALPEKLTDAVKVEKTGGKSAYGLTILSGQTTKYPFAYDVNGEIRWYITMTTGSYGVFPLSNKRLIYQTDEALTPTEEKPHTTQMYEMDYLGRAYQLYYVKNGIHHEVIEKTPGGNLLVLTSSIDGHTEDVVAELDRQTGEIVKSLDMGEIFDDTYQNKVDWVHLNTVSYQEKDNSILLSPRNLHSAVKVDWQTDEIKWILTNPEMFEGTKQEDKVLAPSGDFIWHFQQHSVYEIPDDLDGNPDTIHIMLYDNHWQTKRKVDFFDGREQSYVSVYTVDEKRMTVRQEKTFPGVRSIITSNCTYDSDEKHIFSFGGYLHPFIGGQKGMIYEFDYESGEIKNQYSAKYYFYRGYEMQIDWQDLAEPLNTRDDVVKGTLQAPIVTKDREIPSKKMEDKVSFVLRESVLYMNTSDHAISKIRFIGKKGSYIMDYSSAGKGMKSKSNQKYAIAIPLSGLAEDRYAIAVLYGEQWYDTGKWFERKGEIRK